MKHDRNYSLIYTERRTTRRSNGHVRKRFNHVNYEIEQAFRCLWCQGLVTPDAWLSGVHHRNHCPYCLYSRHLDWLMAGDRLSACKSLMKPIGITLKKTHKKYGPSGQGELMLIHQCLECGKISFNRVAADDDPLTLFTVLLQPKVSDLPCQLMMNKDDIILLNSDDIDIVKAKLWGIRR